MIIVEGYSELANLQTCLKVREVNDIRLILGTLGKKKLKNIAEKDPKNK